MDMNADDKILQVLIQISWNALQILFMIKTVRQAAIQTLTLLYEEVISNFVIP